MTGDISIFICGRKPDHEHDDDGPAVVFFSDGAVKAESLARQAADFPKGIVGASVTCSRCGMASAHDMREWI